MSIAIALIIILWANYITDFLFQTKKMGKNKHHSILWLLAHIGSYTFYFSLLLILYNTIAITFTWINLFHLIWINAITHLIVDFTTSKITAYFYQKHQFRSFLKVIGLDTLIHTTILIILTFLFINIT